MKRKIISIVLCVCILALTASVGFTGGAVNGGVSIKSGMTALRAQFESGQAPVSNGITLDYVYFSPVTQGDNTKYPLVIWLHGLRSGSYPGEQIILNDIANWSSTEYQSRFADAGGAYIFCPRSPGMPFTLWGPEMTIPLKDTIDYFISQNADNIDTSRIYIGGLSMGGKMTIRMVSSYPNFFAASFPVAPAYSPSTAELDNISNTPTWLVVSTIDPYVSYNDTIVPAWKYLKAKTNRPNDFRMSAITLACYPNGIPIYNTHYVWYAVTNDMFTDNNKEYYNMTTQDGTGAKISLTYPDGMISWLSQYSTDGADSSSTFNLFNFIASFFVLLLKYVINVIL